MSYTTATQGASAICAKDFMNNVIDPYLVANGYTFVEEWLSGADCTRVYKNPIGGNGVIDWYLFVRRATDAALLVNFHVAEDWDATGKKLKKYVPKTGTLAAPNSAANYTITDAVGVAPNSATNLTQLTNLTIAAAGFQYWFSFNNQRILIGTKVGATENSIYCGLLDSVVATSVASADVALYQGIMYDNISINSTVDASRGGFTREPTVTVTSANNFAGGLGFSASNYGWGYYTSAVDFYSGRYSASRVCISGGRATATNAPRGLLKGVYYAPGAVGSVMGDTATIGSKNCVRIAQSGGNGNYFFTDIAL